MEVHFYPTFRNINFVDTFPALAKRGSVLYALVNSCTQVLRFSRINYTFEVALMSLRRGFILLVSSILLLGGLALGAGANEPAEVNLPIDADLPVMYTTEGLIPDSVIVEFDDRSLMRSAQAADNLPGVAFDRAMTHRPLARYTILDGRTPFETITRLRRFTNIRDVFPNYIRSAAAMPNDPYMTLQIEEIQVAQIPSAWDIETGSADVLVAVIDTGVDEEHEDLLANMILPGINVREDGLETVMDDSGHGTAVMGVIGGVGNNGIGIAGVNWTVTMLPIRAAGGAQLQCDLFDEVEGIDAARVAGADIINLSIGGVGTISHEEDAVTSAYEADILIIAAAGNSNPDFVSQEDMLFEATGDPAWDRSRLYYPAGLPEVLGVGSIENDGTKSDFSHYGEDILGVMAPGRDIVTTVPNYPCALYEGGDNPPYGLATGTSFATPMVAGVAALILAHYPGLSPDEIRARIEGTAIPMAGPDEDENGINDYFGHGILNAAGALSQGIAPDNPYFELTVSSNPLIPGEVLVLVKALVELDSNPRLRWDMDTENGSVDMSPVETRPGFYIGRFNPGSSGNIAISVTGFSGGAPLPNVSVMYVLGD